VIFAAFTGLRGGDLLASGCENLEGRGDENRTRIASLEDETLEALARRFPYLQRKWLTMVSRQ
jgi:hypothetical protein